MRHAWPRSVPRLMSSGRRRGASAAARRRAHATGQRAVRLLPEHQHHSRQQARHRRRRHRRVQGWLPCDRAVDQRDRRLHVEGGTLKDLGKRIADAGLTVEDAIAFNSFLDDDDARRAASMEKLKIDMDKVAQIGGKRIAAPPGNNRAAVSLDNAAKYYREALEMGEKMGVQPLLELWGTHPVLGPLSHGIYVTVAAGRADASLLLDVFHLYKSGTPFTALKQINGASLHVMHLNDYPQAADSVHAQRRQPDLPGRRRRAAAPDPARPARQRLPRLSVARAVQPRLLDPQRRREPEDGDGEDPRHGAFGDGLAGRVARTEAGVSRHS